MEKGYLYKNGKYVLPTPEEEAEIEKVVAEANRVLKSKAPTTEERLSAIEELLLGLIGGGENVL